MMIGSAILSFAPRDYGDYIACAYGLAAFLLAALVVQSVLSARKTEKSLAAFEREMAQDGPPPRGGDA
jgi:heme exporter protein CcmD